MPIKTVVSKNAMVSGPLNKISTVIGVKTMLIPVKKICNKKMTKVILIK